MNCPQCGGEDWSTVDICPGCLRKTSGPVTMRIHQCPNEPIISMTVARLGGTVEGRATGKHNFLQRVDALRDLERLMVDVDSHLSAIIHRYGSRLPEAFLKDIGVTLDEIQKVTRARG